MWLIENGANYELKRTKTLAQSDKSNNLHHSQQVQRNRVSKPKCRILQVNDLKKPGF